jgi:hypothetical protein
MFYFRKRCLRFIFLKLSLLCLTLFIMFIDMVAHDILNLKLLFSSLWKIEDIVFGDSHGKHCL